MHSRPIAIKSNDDEWKCGQSALCLSAVVEVVRVLVCSMPGINGSVAGRT